MSYALVLPYRFSTPTTAAQTFLVNQNFETPTTGYDNGETWTSNGTVDPVYTGTVLRGTQSLRLPAPPNAVNWTYTTYANQTSDVWAFVEFQALLLPQSTDSAIRIADSSNTVLVGLEILTSDGGVHASYKLVSNGVESSASAYGPVASGLHQYAWLHWAPGGTCEVSVGSTTTKPTSDSASAAYLTGTGATGTASRIFLYNQFSGDLVMDHVLVSATSIGNNP